MYESDLERTREYLKSRLPEYLRRHGINPEGHFHCLNPAHPDHQHSMSCSLRDYTVHCPECTASYDIFDLVGLEYGLHDPKARYQKVCELFLGTANTPREAAPQAGSGSRLENAGAASFSSRRSEPSFAANNAEAADGRRPLPQRTPFTTPFPPPQRSGKAEFGGAAEFGGSAAEFGDSRPAPRPRSFAEERVPAFPKAAAQPASGAVFGISSSAPQRSGSAPFAGGCGTRPQPESREKQYSYPENFAEYLHTAALNAGNTDFFHLHGLSDEVIRRFRLGFDEKLRTGNSVGDPVCWQAAVIPSSDYSFTACNTDTAARDKIRKIGVPAVFNEKALEQPGAVFITDSELDALSLETLGCRAMAAGSSRPGQLLDLIARSRRSPERIFYICLPDDAQDGELVSLCDGLYKLGLPAKRIDPAFPYGTLNQALCCDRENLAWKMEHLEELLSCSMAAAEYDDEDYSFIDNSAALSKLDLSPYLYCLCGCSHVLRRVMHLVLEERLCRLITVTTRMNWKFMCHGLGDTDGAGADPAFDAGPGPQAVFTDNQAPEDLAQKLRFVLNALRLQGGGDFAVAVDLSAADQGQLRRLLPQLSALCTELCTGLLLLCPAGSLELCEGSALQTIEVTQSEDGSELEFNSADLNCRRISFTRYAGL